MPDVLPQGITANKISLRVGHPDPSTLVTPQIQECIEALARNPQAALAYGPEQGMPGLIALLADKASRDFGCAIPPTRLMITGGSTQAVDMMTRLYAKPGGVVIVEAPTYIDALHIFRDHHVDLRSVPIDEHGLIVAELEALLLRLRDDGKTPSFLYTIPNFHNPSGVTLSEARRIEILRLARHYGFLIVEDDVYRHLAFEGSVPASFYALSGGEQVISIGSFSKTLAPGLRVGWMVSTETIIDRCVNSGVVQMGGGANPISAQIVYEYCRRGYWEPHVADLRAVYRRRCDVALSALSRAMPPGVQWTHPAGGYFIWLTLPESLSAAQVKAAAFDQGVLIASGEGFFVEPSDGIHNLRIAFSFPPLSDLETGIGILGRVIADAIGNL